MSARHPNRSDRLLDLAPVGIHHTDPIGVCRWVNQRWAALTGVSQAEACGRPWVDALHADDRDSVLAQWLETVARGLEFVCDVRLAGAGGHTTQATLRSTPVLDDHGVLTGHVAALTELPDRRHDTLRRLIVENLTDVVLFFDMRRELLYATPSFEDLTGRRVEDAACHVHEGLGVHADDAPRMRSLWAGLWDGEGYAGAEFRVVTADGGERWCTSAGAPVLDAGGRQMGVQIRHADVTGRRHIEERVRESEERARSIVATTSDAFVATDAGGIVMEWNGAAELLFGWEREEAIGAPFAELVLAAEGRDAVTTAMARHRDSGGRSGLGAAAEVRARRRDGGEFIAEMTIWPIGSGEGSSFNAFISDITERKRREQAVRHLAFHDRLTGLPNRARFEERVDEALAWVDGTAGAAAAGLLFLDIDRLKHVNDTMGHDAGDELLRQVAERLRRGARSNDVVARLAGDEFVVLVTELPAAGAADIAEQVARRVQAALSEPYTLAGSAFSTTVSIGVAVYPDHAADAAGLVKAADTSMYESKRAGRGRISRADWRADAA
ncbi:MAG TPA: diguanylate cyclase [Gaiellales bacterium]|nr:diguanylate cyclase [Gaiellales bacterium]